MSKREITREDIMEMGEYAKIRREHRRNLVAVKKNRRMDVGPFVTFYFENYDTMWAQIHEMLFIEQGGEEQIGGELEAYNPLIPQGSELVCTMMIEIEDEIRRRNTLARLGYVEDKISLQFGGEKVTAVPEDDVERTTEEGKTSSVHFLHFKFSDEQVAKFKDEGTQVILAIEHENYAHMAVLPEGTRLELAGDMV